MSDSARIRVGDWIMTPALNLLERGEESIRLEPRAMDVLAHLARRPGEVVSVDELIAAVWQGVVVSDRSVYLAISQLRRTLGDRESGARYIETIRKRGYRLTARVEPVEPVEPVESTERASELGVAVPAAKAEAGAESACRGPVPAARLGGVVAIAIALAGAVALLGTRDETGGSIPEAPPKVAVLPCENLSLDPDDAYFAAGIHEEILNRLVQLSGLRVVARSSVLQYAESRPPIRQVAGELNVAAVMECSVRYAGNSVLVTAQLIDPLTDTHIWSQAYRGDRSDVSELFAMQADIGTNIARALRAELSPAEERRINRPRTDSMEAYAGFLRWQQEYRLGLPPHAAFGYLDRAIEVDPDFALAYAARGGLHIDAANMSSISRIIAPDAAPELFDAERQFELARGDALRALEIDPELGFAHSILAGVSMFTGDNDAARESFDRALELSPGDPLTLRNYAVFHIVANRFHEGLDLLDRASQLDPDFVDPLHYAMAGELDVAREHARREIDQNPLSPRAHLVLGVLEATIFGDAETAERELRLTEQLVEDNAVFFHLTTNLFVVYAYGRLGLIADARRVYDEVLAMLPDGRVLGPTARLRAHLAFGEISEAYECAMEIADNPLPLAYRGPQIFMLNTLNDAVLDRPEFVELRHKLGYRP